MGLARVIGSNGYGKGNKWLDEPMLSCSHGRPGRNRDICRGHSRVGLDSPWMLWMLLHMDFDGTNLRAGRSGREREDVLGKL